MYIDGSLLRFDSVHLVPVRATGGSLPIEKSGVRPYAHIHHLLDVYLDVYVNMYRHMYVP
jgi:hypothetical protein